MAFSVTVRVAVMLFVKLAVAEVPLAVMLPDQFVGVIQFPLAFAVQDPSSAINCGADGKNIATETTRAPRWHLQNLFFLFFMVLWGGHCDFFEQL